MVGGTAINISRHIWFNLLNYTMVVIGQVATSRDVPIWFNLLNCTKSCIVDNLLEVLNGSSFSKSGSSFVISRLISTDFYLSCLGLTVLSSPISLADSLKFSITYLNIVLALSFPLY